MPYSTGKLKPIIQQLYKARNKLQSEVPELDFTLDGKLIGDIGEAIAMKRYGLLKLPANTKTHDLKTPNGLNVQVKATQSGQAGKVVGFGRKKHTYEHLLVFQIMENGDYDIIYNGPGSYIDQERAARPTKKSCDMTVAQLRRLHDKVEENERISTQL